MKLQKATIIFTLLGTTLYAHASEKINYHVKLSGIKGAPLQNVRAAFVINRKDYDKLSAYDARQLYRQASSTIKKALQPYGYYNATVMKHLQKNKQNYTAWFVIKPGKKMHIDELSIKISGPGKNNPALQAALKSIPLHHGMVLNVQNYKKAKTKLILVAKQQGYLFAKFTTDKTEINLNSYQSYMQLELNTDIRFYFGKFTFLDKTPLSERFLRQYITIKPGQPFNEQRLSKLQSDYGSSGYFRNVRVTPQINRPHVGKNVIPVDINMQMNKKHMYQVGGGYGSESGLRLRLATKGRWVGSNGDNYNASTVLSRTYYQASAAYIMPTQHPLTDNYSLNVSLSLIQPNYIGKAFVSKIGPGYTWQNNFWTLNSYLYLFYERWRLQNSGPYTHSQMIQPDINLIYNTAKNTVLVENGYKLTLSLTGALKNIYSSLTYLQPELQFKWIKTLGKNNRLIFNTQIGTTLSNDKKALPLSERFFAGGIGSVLGYNFQSIGPGSNLSVIGLNYLRRVYSDFYTGPFYDVGNAYNGKFSNYRKNLQRSAGLNVVWRSPIGDISLYWAKALSTTGAPNRFGITLGPEL